MDKHNNFPRQNEGPYGDEEDAQYDHFHPRKHDLYELDPEDARSVFAEYDDLIFVSDVMCTKDAYGQIVALWYEIERAHHDRKRLSTLLERQRRINTRLRQRLSRLEALFAPQE